MTLGWDSTRAPVAVTSTGAAQHASARHGAGWDSTRAPLAVTSTGAAQHASAHHGAGWDSTRAPVATGAAQHASAHHGADATGAAANASERARACLEQPSVIWAGSHRAGLAPGAALPNKDLPNQDLPHQGTSRAEAVRRQLLDAVRAHLVKLDPTAAEWVGNLTVHLDERPTQRASVHHGAVSLPHRWAISPSISTNAQHASAHHGAVSLPHRWAISPSISTNAQHSAHPAGRRSLPPPAPELPRTHGWSFLLTMESARSSMGISAHSL
jgi:hypothetical protein